MMDGLVKTLCVRQDQWTTEKQRLEERVRGLEEHLLVHEENLVTPPEGYVENGGRVK
jgi:hypothetical protein